MMQSAEQIVAVRVSRAQPRRTSGGGQPSDHEEKTAPGLDEGPPVLPSVFLPRSDRPPRRWFTTCTAVDGERGIASAASTRR